MTQKLGKIEKVDIKDIWSHEAKDFTPWLARNITQLGDALGMELALHDTEAAVGKFSLDILATDINGNRPVVVENQLNVTDHIHLGQLLTYAAGFDANVVVWLTSDFREEHRAALDWLNTRTGQDTEFFGVVVELWRIGSSPPAPHFNLVVAPNEWRKTGVGTGTPASAGASERGERYRLFWQELIDSLRDEHSFPQRKAGSGNWFSYSSGHSGVTYNVTFAQGGLARTEVYIDGGNRDWNKELFDKIKDRQESIESELSDSLNWESLDNRRACRISVVRTGSIDDDSETLENVQNWMIKRLTTFRGVFGPHLEELI